jgi:hypothetical protein
MLTADKGIRSKVAKSNQAARIIVAAPEELMDSQKTESVSLVDMTMRLV